jgi:hypothetical protein
MRRLLTDLEDGVDRTTGRLDGAMKKMRKFIRQQEGMYARCDCFAESELIRSHSETKSGWCIVILIIILLGLLLAVILI